MNLFCFWDVRMLMGIANNGSVRIGINIGTLFYSDQPKINILNLNANPTIVCVSFGVWWIIFLIFPCIVRELNFEINCKFCCDNVIYNMEKQAYGTGQSKHCKKIFEIWIYFPHIITAVHFRKKLWNSWQFWTIFSLRMAIWGLLLKGKLSKGKSGLMAAFGQAA